MHLLPKINRTQVVPQRKCPVSSVGSVLKGGMSTCNTKVANWRSDNEYLRRRPEYYINSRDRENWSKATARNHVALGSRRRDREKIYETPKT